MEIKFEAFTPEEMLMAADFLQRMATLRQRQMQPKDEAPSFVDQVEKVRASKLGSVLGGIAVWPAVEHG